MMTPLTIVLLGPPGAGKSTAAAPLAERYGLRSVSTGQWMRDEMEAETPLGASIAPFMEHGELVPDELMERLMRRYLEQLGPQVGLLLDGYPRTVPQAATLETVLPDVGRTLAAVVYFDLSDDEVVRRLSGRRICETDEGRFPVHLDDPESLRRCEERGGTLVHRDDDVPDLIRQRLAVYHEVTAPLIAFYTERGLLRRVGASGAPDAVTVRVEQVIRGITNSSIV